MLLVGYAVVVFLGVYIGSINDLENQLVGYRVDRGDGRPVGILFSGDLLSICVWYTGLGGRYIGI